ARGRVPAAGILEQGRCVQSGKLAGELRVLPGVLLGRSDRTVPAAEPAGQPPLAADLRRAGVPGIRSRSGRLAGRFRLRHPAAAARSPARRAAPGGRLPAWAGGTTAGPGRSTGRSPRVSSVRLPAGRARLRHLLAAEPVYRRRPVPSPAAEG